jgi:hypothetical protein
MLGLFVCQELMRCLFFRLRQSNLASHRLAFPALPVYRFRRRTLISHSLKPAWSDRSSLLRERSQAGLPSPPPLSFMGLNHLETFAIRCARSINLLRIRLEPSSQFGFFCHLIARYYSAYNFLDYLSVKSDKQRGIYYLRLHDCVVLVPDHRTIYRKTSYLEDRRQAYCCQRSYEVCTQLTLHSK